MFVPAQLLHSWCDQHLSNQGDFDVIVIGEVGSVCYMGVDLLLV
jgi:hypothetical protein